MGAAMVDDWDPSRLIHASFKLLRVITLSYTAYIVRVHFIYEALPIY